MSHVGPVVLTGRQATRPSGVAAFAGGDDGDDRAKVASVPAQSFPVTTLATTTSTTATTTTAPPTTVPPAGPAIELHILRAENNEPFPALGE